MTGVTTGSMSEVLGAAPISALDELVVKVYSQALGYSSTTAKQLASDLDCPVDVVEDAVAKLIDLRHLAIGGCPGEVVPLSPDVAEVELIGPREELIRRSHQELVELRSELGTLAEAFESIRTARLHEEALVYTASAESTRLRFADAVRRCRGEVLTMHPGGGRDADELTEATPRDLELLQRGVRMSIIYQHPARTDVATRAYVEQVTAAGAQVRTVNEIFERLVIFDREIAFVPQPGSTGGAVIVHEPALVAVLARIHEHTWRSATVFHPEKVAYDGTLDDVKTTILQLLANGLKDDAIAKRLGMSSRTCRRHIASLLSELRANSRFQAGVAAAQAGIVPELVDAFEGS